MFSIFLPGVVVGAAVHTCTERFLHSGQASKGSPYWSAYIQRASIQMFLELFREHGHFLPVPSGQFAEKFPRLHRLMVTDMLVSDPGGENGKCNRPPTNLCTLAAILAFCMGRQYQLYEKAKVAAKNKFNKLRSGKKDEKSALDEVRSEFGRDLQRRFMLLPSKTVCMQSLNEKWVATKKNPNPEVTSMVSSSLVEDIGQRLRQRLRSNTEEVTQEEVELASVESVFRGLRGFTPSVWAVPQDHFEEWPRWNAKEELQFKHTRTEKEKKERKRTKESEPMDQLYHRSLKEIVRGIFVEQLPEFDCVAGCLEEHLQHFQVQKHFSFYWHHSSLTTRKAAECFSPAYHISKYFGAEDKFEFNEVNDVPRDGGGFDPDFLFAYPAPKGQAVDPEVAVVEDEKGGKEESFREAKRSILSGRPLG